jgi:hypothetical protein
MLVLSSLYRKLCHEFRFGVCRLFITGILQEDGTNFVAFINNASNLTFRGPCIVIYSYNKTNEMN